MSQKVLQHRGSNSFFASLALLIVAFGAAVTLGCSGGTPATPPASGTPPFQGGTGGSPIGIIGASPPSPQGVLNPGSINFGDVAVNGSFSVAVQLTNTGNADLQVTQVALAGATSFSLSGITSPLVVAPGQAASFSVQFAPQAVGAANSTLTVTSNSATPVPAAALSGNGIMPAGAQLSANPSAFDFGAVTIGSPATQPVTLRNTGGQNVIISAISAPVGAGFSITNLPGLPLTLTPGQAQVLNVQFAPTAIGPVVGGFTVTSDAPNSPTPVVLGGQGIAATLTLNVNPTAIDFGGIIVGSSATQNVVMTNTGNTSITVTAANVAGASYSIAPALALPATLAPGQSQAFTVQFAPGATGAANGSIALVSNASNSPTQVTLTGSGLAQTQTLVLNPSSIGFGDVVVGSNSTRPVTVTNTGNTTVTITAANAAAGFSQIGLTFPVTLTPGQSAPFSARFAPAAAGPANGLISLVTAAGNTDLTVTGNGLAQILTLSVNPVVIGFGDVVTITGSDTRSVTVTNTGNANVIITAANVTGAGFSQTGLTPPLTLTPGQSSGFTARFAPTVAGPVVGSISLVSNATASPTLVGLAGNAVAAAVQALTANPTNINFGDVFVGNNDVRTITLTNTGNVNVNITSATPAGSGYSISGLTLPLTLTPGQSQPFTAQFTPASAGNSVGGLTIVSDATNSPNLISFTGNGVAQAATLTANPTSIAYGIVIVGQGQNQTVTITNTGNVNVTVNSATPNAAATGAGFTVTGFTAGPLTPGQTMNFTVRYAPIAAGASTAGSNVSVLSTASNSPTTVTVSGTGVATAATLSASPSSIPFGNVNVGSVATQSVTLTNTGNVSVTVNSAAPNVAASTAGYTVTGFTAGALAPGQTMNFTVLFAPTAGGSTPGTSVSVLSTASNSPTTVTVTGAGVPPTLILTANPASVNFGTVGVGSNATQSVTITNTGTASVTVNSATPSGAGFSVTGFTAGTLTPGQTMNFTVQFAPTAAGLANGNVAVASTATASPANITLSGTGQAAAPAITVNPASVNFGSVVIGSNLPQSIVVTNTGNLPLNISAASDISATRFSTTGLTLPRTLNPGQSFSFAVVYSPNSATPSSATLTLTHNAGAGATAIPLTGTGTTGVTLAWDDPNNPPGSVGYRIYRSTTAGGGFTLLNPTSLLAARSFVDTSVVAGTTYFYVVAAVDADGVESIFSTQLTVPL